MGRDRAAYMRQYRARKNATRIIFHAGTDDAKEVLRLHDRVKELEAEVARLKRELAARPPEPAYPEYDRTLHDFNSRPFTPVPKKR